MNLFTTEVTRKNGELSAEEVSYIKQPTFSIFGPFNSLARGQWGLILLGIIINWIVNLLGLADSALNVVSVITSLGIIYLGYRYSRVWAWNTNNWASFEVFKASEKRWTPWGVVFLVLSLLALILGTAMLSLGGIS